jgi:hypothetical protein
MGFFLKVSAHILLYLLDLFDDILIFFKAHSNIVKHHEHILLHDPVISLSILDCILFVCQLIVQLMQLPDGLVVVMLDLVNVQRLTDAL